MIPDHRNGRHETTSGADPALPAAPVDDHPLGPSPFAPEAVARRQRLMVLSLGIALALVVVKGAGWWLTGSRGLLSDALESIVNVVTAAFGTWSVSLAGRPPDRAHPYGHGKVEFFAAGLEGALILVAAAGIFREAIPALLHPRPVERMGWGLGLAALAAAVNLAAGTLFVRVGKRQSSATLVGEGHHLLADTLTTVGVIGGLVLVRLTGNPVFDPLAALLVGAWIAWTGFGLLRESAARLMDRADPEILGQVARVLQREARENPWWIEAHLLRAWVSGEFVHVDFHLTMPRWWTLDQVHEAQHRMLPLIIRELGRPGEVLIHPDPCEPSLCRMCRVDPCPRRAANQVDEADWSLDKLLSGPAERPQDSCQVALAEESRRVSGGGDGRGR